MTIKTMLLDLLIGVIIAGLAYWVYRETDNGLYLAAIIVLGTAVFVYLGWKRSPK